MYTLHASKTVNRRLSASESKEIANAAAVGESVTALAARFGVSRPTIYRAIEKQGGGRPKKADAEIISARVTPFERAAFEQLAVREGVSRSEMARRVLRRAAEFLEADPEMAEAVRDLTRQIKPIGGNLNQIASHLNREARMQGKASPSASQLRQVEQCEREVKRLAKELDGLFVNLVRRRRVRLADLLRATQK